MPAMNIVVDEWLPEDKINYSVYLPEDTLSTFPIS